MKTDKNYKMSKPLKRRLALAKYPSEQVRNAWKKAMIGAEVTQRNSEFAITFK